MGKSMRSAGKMQQDCYGIKETKKGYAILIWNIQGILEIT